MGILTGQGLSLCGHAAISSVHLGWTARQARVALLSLVISANVLPQYILERQRNANGVQMSQGGHKRASELTSPKEWTAGDA